MSVLTPGKQPDEPRRSEQVCEHDFPHPQQEGHARAAHAACSITTTRLGPGRIRQTSDSTNVLSTHTRTGDQRPPARGTKLSLFVGDITCAGARRRLRRRHANHHHHHHAPRGLCSRSPVERRHRGGRVTGRAASDNASGQGGGSFGIVTERSGAWRHSPIHPGRKAGMHART